MIVYDRILRNPTKARGVIVGWLLLLLRYCIVVIIYYCDILNGVEHVLPPFNMCNTPSMSPRAYFAASWVLQFRTSGRRNNSIIRISSNSNCRTTSLAVNKGPCIILYWSSEQVQVVVETTGCSNSSNSNYRTISLRVWRMPIVWMKPWTRTKF